MTHPRQTLYHVFPGPQRSTGIRTYAQLLERILAAGAPEVAVRTIAPEDPWWETLPPRAQVLVQIGRNEGDMHWFLLDAARKRPDLRRYILVHDPPDLSIEKRPWMRNLGKSRWGRAVRRGINLVFGNLLDREVVRESDVFLAMSEGGCQAIRRRMETLGRWIASVQIVPHGVYLGDRPEAPPGNPTAERLQIGFFGYISPSKGIGILLEAGRILLAQEKYRDRIRFTIAGNPDSAHSASVLASQIRDIQTAGLSEWFEFLPGPADAQLPDLLGRFDLLALPYLRAASNSASGPLHWAWTIGIPAIANANPYFDECLRRSGAGLVVDEPTGAAWAALLASVLDDPGRLETLRTNALEQRRRNSWPLVADRFREVLGADRIAEPSSASDAREA